MTVGERFRVLFERSGLTKEEVARRSGLTGDQVWNRLQRGIGIQADEVPLLARALGVPVMAFYEDAPARRSTTSPALPRLGDEVLAILEADPLHAAEETVVVNIGEAARTVLVRHSRSLLHLIVERDDGAVQDPPA